MKSGEMQFMLNKEPTKKKTIVSHLVMRFAMRCKFELCKKNQFGLFISQALIPISFQDT